MAFLPTPELRMNYQLMAGPQAAPRAPVVLVHGLGANLAFWYLGAAPLLGQDRPVLMYDLRGHGASSTPPDGYALGTFSDDLGRLLDAMDLGRVHLVGHSHGARIAMAYALRHPARVETLTVADTQLRSLQPPMRLRDWPAWPRWKADLIAHGRESLPPDDAEIDFRVLAELGPRGGARPRPLDEDGPARPIRLLARGDGTGRPTELRGRRMGDRSGRQWQALLDTTTAARELEDETALDPARFRDLTMPALLLYGAQSHCVPTSEGLLDRLPRARRVLVPEAGHFFPLVKPRLFARTLRVFMASAEDERPVPRAMGRPGLRRLAAARAARLQSGAA